MAWRNTKDATSFARFVASTCIAFLIAGTVSAAPLTGPIDPTQPIDQPPVTAPALPGMPDVQPIVIDTMLGFTIGTPIIAFNNTGVLNYTAADGLLSVDADPLAILFNAGDPPALVFDSTTLGPADVLINIIVDNAGNLVGGVPGDDLYVTGSVDLNGDLKTAIRRNTLRYCALRGLCAGLYRCDVPGRAAHPRT